MPTVLRSDGLRGVIYPERSPARPCHVLGSGWVVVINLIGPVVREVINCGEREARRALRLTMSNKAELMDAWNRLHG
jgi:hypothetical protein